MIRTLNRKCFRVMNHVSILHGIMDLLYHELSDEKDGDSVITYYFDGIHTVFQRRSFVHLIVEVLVIAFKINSKPYANYL